MAIDFKRNAGRDKLYAIAIGNGVEVAEDADKTAIIAALDAHNAQERAEASGESEDTPEKNNPAQDPADDPGNMDEHNMFVYIGPTLPRGRLKENAVFRGRIKDVLAYVEDVLTDYPQAAKLIVPTNRLGEYAAKVKKPGNIMHKYYGDIVSAIRNHREV